MQLLIVLLLVITPQLAEAVGPENGTDASVDVTVVLRLHDTETTLSDLLPLRLHATSYDRHPDGNEPEPVAFQASAEGVATVPLPPGRWVIEADLERHWSTRAQVVVQPGVGPATVDLWPAGFVEGGMVVEGKEELPRLVTLLFRPEPGTALDGKIAPATTICPVSEKGGWTCRLPAGQLDLRAETVGFIPRFAWGVPVPRDATHRLGRIRLARGSAVQGWVTTADGARIGKGTVEIRPRHRPFAKDSDRARARSRVFTADINDRGFFEITGVPPGEYLLTARAAPYARATTTARVVTDRVTEISNPPLVLQPPLKLEVFVTPPLDPWGRTWNLRVSGREDPASTVVQQVAAETVPENGALTIPDLSPGSFFIRVLNQDGDGFWAEEVEIDENRGPLFIDLKYVQVEGKVFLGDEPLAATLHFGTRWGAERVELSADEDGAFSGFLPRAGAWDVTVEAQELNVERDLAGVQVEPKSGGRFAELELRLPDAGLSGRVVDESGQGMPKARVRLVNTERFGGDVSVLADDEGRFKLRGLDPARYKLAASSTPDLWSDTLLIDVSESTVDEPEHSLVVRPVQWLRGMLVSDVAMVTGGQVSASAVGKPSLFGRAVTSDARGFFELKLPSGTSEARVTVAAPGFAYRMLRLPVTKERAAIQMDTTGSTLVVELDEPIDWRSETNPFPFFVRNGLSVRLTALLRWARISGGDPEGPLRYVIPMLEPGPIALCAVTPEELPEMAAGDGLPRRQCTNGHLPHGGELTLRMPSVGTESSGPAAHKGDLSASRGGPGNRLQPGTGTAYPVPPL